MSARRRFGDRFRRSRGATRGTRRDRECVRRAGDSGAGSVLAVAIVGAMLIAVALVAPLGAVLAVKQRAAGAADAAALAAADVVVGISAGIPCTVAAEVSRVNGARLTGCTVDDSTATVRVEQTAGVFVIAATATAGPPP